MRRSIYALSLALSTFVRSSRAQDGPDQTFTPEPIAGAANYLNNGGTDAGGRSGDGRVSSSTVVERTSRSRSAPQPQEQARWVEDGCRLRLTPPTTGGGIDMFRRTDLARASRSSRLSRSTARARRPTGTRTPRRTTGAATPKWSSLSYFLSTHKVYYLGFENVGYGGSTRPDEPRSGKHHYSKSARSTRGFTLDGAPLTLDWTGVPANPNARTSWARSKPWSTPSSRRSDRGSPPSRTAYPRGTARSRRSATTPRTCTSRRSDGRSACRAPRRRSRRRARSSTIGRVPREGAPLLVREHDAQARLRGPDSAIETGLGTGRPRPARCA